MTGRRRALVLAGFVITASACVVPPPPASPPITTAAATSAPAPRPPAGGLGWITGSNGTGIFDQAAIDAWERFSGRPVQLAMVATDRSSWATITGRTWAQSNYTDPTLILDTAQPMWPERSGGSFAACGRGDYDAQWSNWGRTVDATPNPIITRLGWEMNGDWWEWSAHDPAAYVACYQRIVRAVRTTAPGAVFEWNINHGWSHTCGGDALNCYPGDPYVDIISIDDYDEWPPSPTEADFNARAEARGGITWLWNFAVTHGKRFGVGEWGVSRKEGEHSGFDNPVFIDGMQRWFRDHAARTPGGLYEAYFNVPDFVNGHREAGSALINPALNPRAAAAYVACRHCR